LGQRLPGLSGLQQRIGTQRIDRGLEVLEGVEALIDAGEAQVGDLVEFAQRIEDGQPHLVGIDLGDALRADVLLDHLRQLRSTSRSVYLACQHCSSATTRSESIAASKSSRESKP